MEHVAVVPFVTNDVHYINATVEDRLTIAHGGTKLDANRNFTEDLAVVRVNGQPDMVQAREVEYIDVSPKQCISVATALIPFLEHDDANRALMGSICNVKLYRV